ncbi:MAG TPA: hypothetical protein VFZ66_23055 [Herpetosiphonaceae bacterium]
MVERLHAGFATLPGLMRVGLMMVLAGGGLGLLYHTLPLAWAAAVDGYLGHDGWSLHAVALPGMAMTLVGIFAGRASLPTDDETERRSASEHDV